VAALRHSASAFTRTPNSAGLVAESIAFINIARATT
jgi:hypothetical protein